MRGSILASQRGGSMIAVLAFLALSAPIVTGGLAVASILSTDSRLKGEVVKHQYTVIGGGQHATYRLLYEDGYVEGLAVGTEDTYTISLNGEDIAVDVAKLTDTASASAPPPVDSSRVLRTSKEVTPPTASADTPTTYAYTITVVNGQDRAKNLRKVHDGLPPGLSYVAGSTFGVTTDDPQITLREDYGVSYYQLTWELASLRISLEPEESAVLSFSVDGTLAEGSYCNQTWVDPGGTKTGSGPTAKIIVGIPQSLYCPGEAVEVTKSVAPEVVPAGTGATVGYAVAVENIGTVDLSLKKIRDLLPEDFLYVDGSTGGATTGDPSATMHQGRQRLDWVFSPARVVLPGESLVVEFDAVSTPAPGKYWNEVWVTIDGFEHTVYTWPTAAVEVMGVLEASASTVQAEANVEVWVGVDGYRIGDWDISR